MTQVKITKSTGLNYWYQTLVGEIFDVYDFSKLDYVLKEDYDNGFDTPWRHILKSDCQILNGDKNRADEGSEGK